MGKAHENTYAELRRRIMAGRYEPGQQLKEEALAAELQVSRTPIRAALRRLVADGLLESRANRGAFAAQWTSRDVDEVIDLRCTLESQAAALAAQRMTEEQAVRLTALNQRMRQLLKGLNSEKVAELQILNNSFHQLVLEAAGSPRLTAATRSLLDWPLVVGSFYVFSAADITRSVQYHDDIILAISARDPGTARSVMEAHLRRSHLTYRAHRKDLPESTN